MLVLGRRAGGQGAVTVTTRPAQAGTQVVAVASSSEDTAFPGLLQGPAEQGRKHRVSQEADERGPGARGREAPVVSSRRDGAVFIF